MGLDVRQEVSDAAVVVSAGGHIDSMTVDAFQSSLRPYPSVDDAIGGG